MKKLFLLLLVSISLTAVAQEKKVSKETDTEKAQRIFGTEPKKEKKVSKGTEPKKEKKVSKETDTKKAQRIFGTEPKKRK